MHSRQATGAWRTAAAAMTLPGLILGHLLSYLLVYPSAHDRVETLHHTGHGGFGPLVVEALVVLPLALGIAAVAALRSTERISLRQAAATMMVLQPAAFLLLELLERDLAATATVSDPAVLVGATLQLPIGAAIVYLLAAVGFAVRWSALRFGRRRPWSVRRSRQVLWAPAVTPVRRFHVRSQVTQRAPPHSLPA